MADGVVGVVDLHDGREYVFVPSGRRCCWCRMRSPNINALAMALAKFGVNAVSFAADKKIGKTIIAEQEVEVRSINTVEFIRFISVFS